MSQEANTKIRQATPLGGGGGGGRESETERERGDERGVEGGGEFVPSMSARHLRTLSLTPIVEVGRRPWEQTKKACP